jgi:hypothetical protein
MEAKQSQELLQNELLKLLKLRICAACVIQIAPGDDQKVKELFTVARPG